MFLDTGLSEVGRYYRWGLWVSSHSGAKTERSSLDLYYTSDHGLLGLLHENLRTIGDRVWVFI